MSASLGAGVAVVRGGVGDPRPERLTDRVPFAFFCIPIGPKFKETP